MTPTTEELTTEVEQPLHVSEHTSGRSTDNQSTPICPPHALTSIRLTATRQRQLESLFTQTDYDTNCNTPSLNHINNLTLYDAFTLSQTAYSSTSADGTF